ncbi:MAG TPA: AAA family ATPase [Mucilaginibacter sp.]|nr:AAA family ATPase [Mucilaginibacter sp.]
MNKPTKPTPYPTPDEAKYMFKLATGNRWLELGEREPDPQMLFGEFWHQHELCILFADTNAGKSVLAVQIGESIARRRKIGPFTCKTKNAVVLYVDFEHSAKQFYLRYTGATGGYDFSPNFYRAQLNLNGEIPYDPQIYDQYIMAAITDRIWQIKATVLIIDNITCMRNGTENGRVALALMKHLRELQNNHHLSILVLAHTPKRNPSRPISTDDLLGSKLLINLADSAFAIGKSKTQPGLSYIKQVKQRSVAEKYGAANVCLCRITQPASFLKFQFQGNGHERDHLYRRTNHDRDHLAQQVAQLKKQGLSQRRISSDLKIPLTTVHRLMQVGNT